MAYVIVEEDEAYLEFMVCSLKEVFSLERNIYLVLDQRNMIEMLPLTLGLENWLLSKMDKKTKATQFQNTFYSNISLKVSLQSMPTFQCWELERM